MNRLEEIKQKIAANGFYGKGCGKFGKRYDSMYEDLVWAVGIILVDEPNEQFPGNSDPVVPPNT